MSMTQPLLTEAALLGPWRLVASRGPTCTIELRPEHTERGRLLRADPACLERLGLKGAGVWRVSSDGIGFADAEGRTLGFFSTEAGGTFRWPGGGPGPIRLLRR